MRDPYNEAVLPIPQIVALVNQAGELLALKRTTLKTKDIEEILELLSKARAALDGNVSNWSV